MGLIFTATKAVTLISILAVAGLTGCGQKGELYREAPAQEPVAQSSAVPTPPISGQAR